MLTHLAQAAVDTGPDLVKGYGEQQVLLVVTFWAAVIWIIREVFVAINGFLHDDGGDER